MSKASKSAHDPSKLVTQTELAEELGVNKSTVSRHASRLGVGTVLGTVVALTRAEADAVQRAIEEAKPGNPNAATARLGMSRKKKEK